MVVRDADPQPLEAAGERGEVVGHGIAAGGRVLGVVPGHDLQECGGIADGAGHRADGVHRPAQRDAAVAADPAVSDLHADDAAERRGLPVRAAGVAADGRERHGGRQRGGVAAAAPARDAGGSHGLRQSP